MQRRHKPVAEPSHERWLISYADFITLLFAFFVVMFASSHADKNKARMVSEAVEQAFSGRQKPAPNAGVQGSAPVGLENLEPSLRKLTRELKDEISAGKMQVRMESRGIVVSLSEATFFPSGEDSLDPSTFGSLEKVARAVKEISNHVRAEGHTDSIPIHTPRFRSNWDLSASRAIAVMELFRDRWGVMASRLAITGYADTVPLESNDTPEGRSRNRRVDIVILNGAGQKSEPLSRNGLRT